MSALHIQFNEPAYKQLAHGNLLSSNGNGNWSPFFLDTQNKIWYAAYSATLYTESDAGLEGSSGALKSCQPMIGNERHQVFPLKGEPIYPPFGPLDSQLAVTIMFGNEGFTSIRHKAVAFQLFPLGNSKDRLQSAVSVEFYNFRVGSDIYMPRQPKRLEIVDYDFGQDWIISAQDKGINAIVIRSNDHFQIRNLVLGNSKSEVQKKMSGPMAIY